MGKRHLYVVMLVFCWSWAAALTPPAHALETIQAHLHQRLENGSRSPAIRVAGERLRASRVVKRFYQQRAYQPAWSSMAGPSSMANALIDNIDMLRHEGLDPHDYHLRALESLVNGTRQPQAGNHTVKLADLELLLSDAFLTAALHLTAGRLKPVERGSKPHPLDTEMINHLERVLTEPIPTNIFHGIIPTHAGYTALRQALTQYRQIAANGGWTTIPRGRTLKLGMQNERVAMLRGRLQVTGDLTPAAVPPSIGPPETAATYFDEPLERAVKQFQKRHGLVVDGSVGRNTLAALNLPVEARERQVSLNMDRLRYHVPAFGKRHIVVNIPNYQLHVIENGQPVMTMRVVVGKPDWQTPTFQSTMTYLVMNPYWVVPEGISQREIIPKVLENPTYLENQNMEMLRGYGNKAKIINPANIDWSTVSTQNFPYRFRQRPGSRNALGRIKFKFPNRFHVYMHDTPARALFAKPKRAFSHGCVRLERPADLATYLLQDHPAWTSERIEKAIKGRQRRHVNLPKPIDVHLIYQTAWVDEDGRLQFRPDIYRLDKKHQKILCQTSYKQCT